MSFLGGVAVGGGVRWLEKGAVEMIAVVFW